MLRLGNIIVRLILGNKTKQLLYNLYLCTYIHQTISSLTSTRVLLSLSSNNRTYNCQRMQTSFICNSYECKNDKMLWGFLKVPLSPLFFPTILAPCHICPRQLFTNMHKNCYYIFSTKHISYKCNKIIKLFEINFPAFFLGREAIT